MSPDLTLAIEAAKAAGQIILENYGKSQKLLKKGANDFATETDRQAEKSIIDRLRPTGYSVFGEETGLTNNKTAKKWVVDPLDGTGNFIKGFSFFAVSIALVENDKELLAGVVYDPVTDRCFWAEKDSGAFLNGAAIHASGNTSFDNSVVLMEHGKSEQSRDTFVRAVTALMQDNGLPMMRQGATALMLCYVAQGSAEAFVACGDEFYDHAAGLLIAREAGAIISDWHGKAWDNSNSYVLACNSGLRTEVLKRIRDLQ